MEHELEFRANVLSYLTSKYLSKIKNLESKISNNQITNSQIINEKRNIIIDYLNCWTEYDCTFIEGIKISGYISFDITKDWTSNDIEMLYLNVKTDLQTIKTTLTRLGVNINE